MRARPPIFLTNAEMKASFVFWNQVAPLHFSKNPRSFSESGCRTEFDKKPRFKPKRGSFSDKSKCRYKLRNACDNQVD